MPMAWRPAASDCAPARTVPQFGLICGEVSHEQYIDRRVCRRTGTVSRRLGDEQDLRHSRAPVRQVRPAGPRADDTGLSADAGRAVVERAFADRHRVWRGADGASDLRAADRRSGDEPVRCLPGDAPAAFHDRRFLADRPCPHHPRHRRRHSGGSRDRPRHAAFCRARRHPRLHALCRHSRLRHRETGRYRQHEPQRRADQGLSLADLWAVPAGDCDRSGRCLRAREDRGASAWWGRR